MVCQRLALHWYRVGRSHKLQAAGREHGATAANQPIWALQARPRVVSGTHLLNTSCNTWAHQCLCVWFPLYLPQNYSHLTSALVLCMQGPSDIIHRIRSVRWSHFGQRSTHIGQDTLSVDEPVSRAVEAPGSSDQHPRILLDDL